VKPPFEMTRTFPELYKVFLVDIEELTQLVKNGHDVSLVWMQIAIENLLCSMDGISDDNDF